MPGLGGVDHARLYVCDRVGLRFPLVAITLVAALVAGAAPVGAQQQDDTIDGAEVVQMLAGAGDGSPGVDLADVTIEGPVELSSLQVVDRPIRCLRCTFTGVVSLADVRFGGVVELVDAVFERPVDARGVVFERAAVLDGARFEERFDASTSRFESVASFAGVDFLGGVSFERATFSDRAVFTGTSREDVDDRLGVCQARRGSSVGAARFAGATFNGPSQFRERCFADPADFAGVRFAGDAEFSVTNFGAAVSFERATFDADASFRVADFGGNASFDGASISETLSFDSAVVRKQLRLSALGGPGALALADVDICQSPDTTSDDQPAEPATNRCSPSADQRLILTRLAVNSVTIDLADIDTIGGPNVRIEVLERVESTARANGRTGVANDARFELLSRRHDRLDQPKRFYDGLFYRDIAGYLVRPTHPLVWFLVLIGIGAVVRTLARSRSLRRPAHPDRRGAGAVSTVIAVVSLFVNGIADTLRTAFSVSLESGSADTPTTNDDGAGTAFNVSLHGGAVAAAPSAGDDATSTSFNLSLKGGAVAAAPSADDDTDDDTDVDTDADVASLGAALLDGLRRIEWLAFKVLIAVFLLGIANANSTVKELIDSVI